MAKRPPALPCVRLLGIDPGTRIAGWGVVELRGASAVRLVACGAIRAPARAGLHVRLLTLFSGYEKVLAAYRPAAAGLEETFAGANPRAAIAMGEGRGVALLALARAGLAVWEISPAEVKKAVTGHGGATKDLVARMVCARLGLRTVPNPPDITDALAVALALAHRWPLGQALG